MPGSPARHGFAARVAAVADAGFDGLTVHFRDHMAQVAAGADPGALRESVAGAGLRVPAVEFLADWHDGPTLGSLPEALETARHFNAETINIGADLAGANVPLDALSEPFRRLTGIAGEAGLTVALEVIAWGAMGTVERAIDLLDQARGPAGLLLDNWHLAFNGTDPDDLPDPALVAGLQISDCLPMTNAMALDPVTQTTMRRFPGDGGLDIAGFLAALWPAAQRCGVAVEVISEEAAAMPLADCATRAADTGRQAVQDAAHIRRGEVCDG